MPKLLILGDISPVKSTMSAFNSGVASSLMGENILSLIKSVDYSIANLECPLIDNPTPAKKVGPVLYGSSLCAQTISNAGISAVSIANNHIRDCGDRGVIETISNCKKNNLVVFGAGRNELEASAANIVDIDKTKIGIISFAEKEFNHLTPYKCGAKAFDVYQDYDAIQNLKQKVDYLIVLYHGGVEYYPYPSPILQIRCRKMVEKGADLVLCQHSHCIGSSEKYANGEILYGQGNCIFGYQENKESWNNGLAVYVQISGPTQNVSYLPIVTNKDNKVDIVENDNTQKVMNAFMDRSVQIQNPEFISTKWGNFCNCQSAMYLPLLYGKSKWFNRINRLIHGRLIKMLYSKHNLNITLNLIQNDSHREVLETILNKYRY